MPGLKRDPVGLLEEQRLPEPFTLSHTTSERMKIAEVVERL
jgi:hypothetical protein